MPKRKIIFTIILITIIALACYFGYKMYKTYRDNLLSIDEANQIKELVIINDENLPEIHPIESSPDDTPSEPKLTLDFAKLKSINKDTVAWIKVANTNIDYPVVKGSNNTYYLNHSFYKNNNINGWIFENYQNSSLFDDDNTVIYGHNTNAKTMFSEIKDIYKGLLGTNIIITVYLEDTEINYKVFSVYLESPDNTTNLSRYLNDDIVANMKNKSKLMIDSNVSGDSKILTLSTCNNVTSDHIILHAVKIS